MARLHNHPRQIVTMDALHAAMQYTVYSKQQQAVLDNLPRSGRKLVDQPGPPSLCHARAFRSSLLLHKGPQRQALQNSGY
uniref:Uncharacterized protein n=1 Tax=Oryza punctata TaxID=4537 RepID=A0A0E0M506_ORYPU